MSFESAIRPSLAVAGLVSALAMQPAAMAATASTRCIDDEARPEVFPPAGGFAARRTLQAVVQEALQRSRAVGASALLAEAAQADVQEARAGALPQSSVGLTAGHSGNTYGGTTLNSSAQAQVGVNIGAPLYDGGRVAALTGWRTQLAEAAKLVKITSQEQVALQSVSLALERARYAQQVQVYRQYGRKMACLVDALKTIVSADQGRASELVQARKSLQQAELLEVQTQSAMRQVEERLRRFVGETPVPVDGLSAALLAVPRLNEVQAAAAQSSEITQLDAQAQAAQTYSLAVAAGARPQLNWTASAGKATSPGQPASWLVGVTLNVPLLNPGVAPATDAAKLRAQAARQQRDDALEARLSRVADVYEQATSALDRARRVVDVLGNSDRVRNFTLQQWQQLGRRSLFDVMAAESDYYSTRVSYINALFDGEQANALLWSLGRGVKAGIE
jgi:outer membrane protein TolC